MTIIRKTSLALAALAVAGFANAGTYTPPACTAHPVTIPCEDTAWNVGFEAFFVEATVSNATYVRTDKLDGTGTNTQTLTTGGYKVTPDYEFGFELEGSYHFSTGNDIIISWERLHQENHADVTLSSDSAITVEAGLGINGLTSSSAAVFTGGSNNLGYPLFNNTVLGTGTLTRSAKAWHNFDFDAVNFEFGQHIDVGNDYDLRIHGGFQYARVDFEKRTVINASSTATGTPTVGTINVAANDSLTSSLDVRQNSDFDGFGLRFGTDMAYHMTDGFSVVGRAAGSLLVGDIENKWNGQFNFSDTTQNASASLTFNHKQCTDSVVVPGLMGKVGLNYQTEAWDGHVSLEGGWRFEGYYHAVNTNSNGDLENFTFHGPFVAIKYVS